MKPKHALVGMLVLLIAAACTQSIQEQKPSFAPAAVQSAWIQKQLLGTRRQLWISKDFEELQSWIVVLSNPIDSNTFSVQTDSNLVGVQRFLGGLHESKADSSTPHGQRLYKLHLKDPLCYSKLGKVQQPHDQVAVLATYLPVLLDTVDRLPKKKGPFGSVLDTFSGWPEKTAITGRDGKRYVQGPLDDLFIMFRTDRPEIETDHGWLYGIVSAQNDSVIAQGLISNCMGCHRKNEPDRLFGLPSDH